MVAGDSAANYKGGADERLLSGMMPRSGYSPEIFSSILISTPNFELSAINLDTILNAYFHSTSQTKFGILVDSGVVTELDRVDYSRDIQDHSLKIV
uniref:Uncharacterized protein n=1 Tax=Romanomermis culicivorax TaxID=13658 RepID=A0A915IEL4_ROMCU